MKFSARIKATIEVYCACLLHQQLGLVLHQQQQQERAQVMSEVTAEMVVGDEHRKDILGSALNLMVESAPPARMAFPVATERPDMSRILETRESKSSSAPWYRDAFLGDAVK